MKIPQLQQRIAVVDPATGRGTAQFIDALNAIFRRIETVLADQQAMIVAIQQAQAAAEAADAAAAQAAAAAATAQTAANTANAAVVTLETEFEGFNTRLRELETATP